MAFTDSAAVEHVSLETLLQRVKEAGERSATAPRHGTAPEPKTLLHLIVDAAACVLNCEAVSILLFDEAVGQLRLAAGTGWSPEQFEAAYVPLDTGLYGIIFTQHRQLIINDEPRASHPLPADDDEVPLGASSWLGVPMRVGDETVGVLEGLNKRSGAFTEADADVLAVLAAQAAAAICNVQQMQELQQANAQLHELNDLQADFLSLVTHELRTPLSAVAGYAAILKEGSPPEQAQLVDLLLEASDQMHHLVEAMGQMEALRPAPHR